MPNKKKATKKKVARGRSYDELASEVIQRCEDAKIECKLARDQEGSQYLAVEMPNGREGRPLYFWEPASIQQFVNAKFEDYIFLGDFDAIASREKQTIEAVLQSQRSMASIIVADAFGVSTEGAESDDPVIITDESFAPDCELRAGIWSDDLHALNPGIGALRGGRKWSIKITGIPFQTHDQALSVLERVSNSLFFQIDLNRGTALSLRRFIRRRRKMGSVHRGDADAAPVFPKTEFDSSPITLYWYARSASGMPLLQFLAYYQCVEFYFPIYSRSVARRRVATILKDPTFRADRDSDLTRVISALSTGPRGFADERSMLRSTIHECLSADELRTYCEQSEERKTFFSKKTNGLTDYRIPIASDDTDLRDHIADRIYDLRCKIVHTKTGSSDESANLLLPYSKEAALMSHDISLIRYIAQRVLIAGSSELKIGK
ncbi:hypothetical protein [Novipirellula rosea]|uniref:Apea-like HEPN domain-containing protein n=1 Tax=Novipirellula rosea TaxID=1031540 RepID=A0ABP8N645_9BACT